MIPPTPSKKQCPSQQMLQGSAFSPVSLSLTFLHWPHFTYQPGCCFYEGGMSSRGPSFGRATHTNKLHRYTGTRDNTQWQVYMPATIVIACGLVHPLPWCGRCFPAVGQGVNIIKILWPAMIGLKDSFLMISSNLGFSFRWTFPLTL